MQREKADDHPGALAVEELDKFVEVLADQPFGEGEMGPADQAVEHRCDLERRDGHHQPAAHRDADHQDIKRNMHGMRGRLLELRHPVGQRRRRIGEAPGEPRKREEKDRDADRLVKLKACLVVFHVPAQPDHEQQQRRHRPVKGNGDAGIP